MMESRIASMSKKREIENYDLAMDILTEIDQPRVSRLIANCVEARMYSLKCEITMLSNALNQTRKDNEKYISESEKLKDEIAEFRAAISVRDTKIDDLSCMVDEYKVDYDQLVDESEANKIRLNKLSEDNDNFDKINRQLKGENSRLTNRIAEYMDELKSKNAEIAALKEVVNTYRDEYYKYSEGLVTQYDEK